MTAHAWPAARHRRARTVTAVLALVLLVGLPAGAQVDAPELPAPALVDAPGADWPGPAEVDGEAYLLVEVATGQRLVAVNADARRPVASTIKLLTAWTVIRRSDLDETVVAGEEVVGVTGSGVGLSPGDQWTVEELLDGLLSRSGNDAAEVLAEHVGGSREAFLRLMEADAAELGVTGLSLRSPSGLDDSQRLSASELATIGRAVLRNAELRRLLASQVVSLPGQPAAESRNELLERYPDATGMKTGFTTLAGYSLVGSAERGGRELLAVVLGAGPDPARFESTITLLEHGYDAMKVTEVGTRIAFQVAGGTVDLVVPPTPVTVPVASAASLELTLPVRPPQGALTFPILVDGATLGTVVAEPSTGPEAVDPGSAQLGRALADGAYAGLRAASAAGTLTTHAADARASGTTRTTAPRPAQPTAGSTASRPGDRSPT